MAKIGGGLAIESLQDTSVFGSKQQSISGSVTVGAGASGSVSASQTKVDGDYASVTEQSGIKAGDGGFQIEVKGGTDLKGGVISSSKAAIDAGKNSLSTATLVTSDIANHDNYKATSVTVRAGTGGGSAGVGQEKGSQSSVTRAGISGADITITDEAAQKALTGKDGSATLAEVNREAATGTDTSGALKKAWDAQQLQEDVQAQASITAEFGKNASKVVGDIAGAKRDGLKADAQRAEREGDTARAAELNAEAAKWDEGGVYRVAAHGVVGGLTGGASGAIGAAAGAAAVPEIAEQVAKLDLSDPVRKAVIAVADTAVGAAAGALAGGGAAGAVAAGNQVVNNYLKHEELQTKHKELAACKDDMCRKGVEKKWSEVSQTRNEKMTASCVDGSSAQCRATLAEAQADAAVLQTHGTGTGLSPLTPEERNNLKQASEKVRTGLEALAERGTQALGTTDPDVLAQAGYLTMQEAKDLKALRLGTGIEAGGALIGSGGTKANSNKPVVGKAEETVPKPTVNEVEVAKIENNASRDASLESGATGKAERQPTAKEGDAAKVDGNVRSANEQQPRAVDEVQERAALTQAIAEARTAMPTRDLRTGGNVAAAQIDITGLPARMTASSRVDAPIDGIVGKGSGNFTYLDLPSKEGRSIPRNTDSEYKILDNIADRLGANTQVSGTVTILTERPACQSCLGVADQFRARFPNIEVKIFDNNGVLLTPLKKPTAGGK